jgi:hypothetical protein
MAAEVAASLALWVTWSQPASREMRRTEMVFSQLLDAKDFS